MARLHIMIVITARPSYAKAETVIAACLARGWAVHVVCAASALLERYGRVRDIIGQEWPHVPVTEVWSSYEGATLLTSVKETGVLCSELGTVFAATRPDWVVVIADRYEVLAAAQAAAYQHLPLCHLQGGERSGSIDDKVRDAVSALADRHGAATLEAAAHLQRWVRCPEHVQWVGCPAVDLAARAVGDSPVTSMELAAIGVGPVPDLTQPFVVVLQHPVTTTVDQVAAAYRTTLTAVATIGLPACILWPGHDAGSEAMSKVLRQWPPDHPWHLIRSLPPRRFLRLLRQCVCLVGNSSVGIREGSYLGVPTVNIGDRQAGRERARNVVDSEGAVAAIVTAIRCQIQHGPYQGTTLYGLGDAGARIAEWLAS